MSSNLDDVVQLGHDIISQKYYSLATGVILFYDYFLTLSDEIKYVWSEKRSWAFWLFIFIRYFPMSWHLWHLGLSYTPQFDQTVCDKTAWYSLFVFIVCTLLAQVMLILRIHAVMMKKLSITIWFSVMSASQFVLGVGVTIDAALVGAQVPPQIPLDAYHLCVFVRHRTLEIVYTSISLLFDCLAFLLIISWANKSKALKHNVTSILDTIEEGSKLYFLLIFSSHFALVMTLNLGRPTIQLIPAPGSVVYLSVMASRTMLSLRKAADLRQDAQSLVEPSTDSPDLQGTELYRFRRGATQHTARHASEGGGSRSSDNEFRSVTR